VSEERVNSPWLTRKEAAEYLRLDISTIDKRLVKMGPRAIAGKIRCETVKLGGKHPPIRLLAEDVYALLPAPNVDQAEPANVVEFNEAVGR
jgi:hypothetical protein